MQHATIEIDARTRACQVRAKPAYQNKIFVQVEERKIATREFSTSRANSTTGTSENRGNPREIDTSERCSPFAWRANCTLRLHRSRSRVLFEVLQGRSALKGAFSRGACWQTGSTC